MLLTTIRLSSILVINSSLFPRMLPSFSYLKGMVMIVIDFQMFYTLVIISINYASFSAWMAICTNYSLNLSKSSYLKYSKV